ncbi:MAG: hypothetical protein A2297_06575 [Elusimicrobia bacterium RIFOXYB2_FULL_48_7]|nr:MAG: hypothetical protein A2297_06575 [Elusimicrobia bacterium RIFOXYB2_FULL_48_7]
MAFTSSPMAVYALPIPTGRAPTPILRKLAPVVFAEQVSENVKQQIDGTQIRTISLFMLNHYFNQRRLLTF